MSDTKWALDAIEERFRKNPKTDGAYMVAIAVIALADRVGGVAMALDRLGLANAATPMGAIEFLACQIKESTSDLSHVINLCSISLSECASRGDES